MEATVQTKLLRKAMARLQRICTWYPLYIEAADSQLILRNEGCDLLSCEYAIPADVLQPGFFITSWLEKLDQLPGYSTHLITCDQNHCLTLRSGPMWLVRLVKTDSAFYPTIPKMKPVAEFGSDLITAFKKLRPFYSSRALHSALRLEGGHGEHTLALTAYGHGWVKGISGPEHRVKIDIPPALAIELTDAKPNRVLVLEGDTHVGASFGSAPTARLAVLRGEPFHDPPGDLKTIGSVWFDPEPLRAVCHSAFTPLTDIQGVALAFKYTDHMADFCCFDDLFFDNLPADEELENLADEDLEFYAKQSIRQGLHRFFAERVDGAVMQESVSFAGDLKSDLIIARDKERTRDFLDFLSECESDLIRLDFLRDEKNSYVRLSDGEGYSYCWRCAWKEKGELDADQGQKPRRKPVQKHQKLSNRP